MKRLDLIILMVCLQLGIISINLVEIQPGTYFTTGQVNTIYFGAITDVTTTFEEIYNISQIANGDWLNPQPFQICIPTFIVAGPNVCSPTINLPGTQILNIVYSPFKIIFALLKIFIGLLVFSTIGAGIFYTALLATVIPGGISGATLAFTIGMGLGAIQSIILLIEIIKLIPPGGGGK